MPADSTSGWRPALRSKAIATVGPRLQSRRGLEHPDGGIADTPGESLDLCRRREEGRSDALSGLEFHDASPCRRLLGWALTHRKSVVTIAAAMVLLCLSVVMLGMIGTDLFAVVDTGDLSLAVELPVDARLETTSGVVSKMMQLIEENNLNRVVVASCSPRTHEPLFQDTCREAGLNKFLFEMANIRDQCSWVHATHMPEATDKAKDLVRMAVARAAMLEPLHQAKLKTL